MQATVRRKRGDEEIPVERDVRGDEDEIEGAREFPESRLVAGADDMMGTEFPCFIGFGFAGREGGHFAAPFVEELHCQVTQSADANDADAIGRLDSEIRDRREDGDSAAEQGTCAGGIEGGWEFGRPFPIRPHPVGEAAVAADDDSLRIGAELVSAGEAGLAGEATAGKPAEAHAVADGETLRLIADFFDDADDFVTGDERIGRVSPVVVEHRKVRMANPAGFDFHLDLLRLEFARVEFKFGKCCA